MPNDMRTLVRAGLTVLLVCWASLVLTGCRRSAAPDPTGIGSGSGGLPGAPTGGIGTRSGNLPGAPTGSGGTTLAGTPPATPSNPWGTGSDMPVTLTGGDSGGTPAPGGATLPVNLPGTTSGDVDVRTGGQNMESTAYSWAGGAIQPSTNDPTVLRHEAVHYINSELSGGASWQNLSSDVYRAFYMWGTNQYYVVPHTGVRKIDVLGLVPTHLTNSYQNYFYNLDFSSRDALHFLEDFSAELGSGEKSPLLFDMLVYSAALGLKLEQLNAGGQNGYWGKAGGATYRGTVKAFIEMAAPGLEGHLQAFATDGNALTAALRSFLQRTYGAAWTKQVLGF